MFITSLRLIDRIVTERASDCGLPNLPTFHLFQTLASKEKAWSAAVVAGGEGVNPLRNRNKALSVTTGSIKHVLFLNVNTWGEIKRKKTRQAGFAVLCGLIVACVGN